VIGDEIKNKATQGLDLIPAHMHGGVMRYLGGIRPGGFLCALLSGNRDAAIKHGDPTNLLAILSGSWDRFLGGYMPPETYGSPEKFEAWLAKAKDGAS
jgi:hypothetical protein